MQCSAAIRTILLSILIPPLVAGAGGAADERVPELVREGRELAAKADHEAAFTRFDQALALDPDAAEAHAWKAASLLARRDVPGARTSIERAIKLRKGDAWFHVISGRIAVAEERYEDAGKSYDLAARLTPGEAGKFYADLASALAARKDDKLAPEIETALKKAVDARPPDLDSLFNLGQSYVSAGREEGATYLRRYVDEQAKLPKEKRNEQRIRVAKQMIRAMDILKRDA